MNAEGQVSYKALLFIPGKQLLTYESPITSRACSSTARGVTIMEKCPDLLAESFYLRARHRGLAGPSLNISRKCSSTTGKLRIIAQNLNKRIKNELLKMLENDRPKYEKFYKNYGRQLRYGAVANFGQNIESLRDLLTLQRRGGQDRDAQGIYGPDARRAEVHLLRRGRLCVQDAAPAPGGAGALEGASRSCA